MRRSVLPLDRAADLAEQGFSGQINGFCCSVVRGNLAGKESFYKASSGESTGARLLHQGRSFFSQIAIGGPCCISDARYAKSLTQIQDSSQRPTI